MSYTGPASDPKTLSVFHEGCIFRKKDISPHRLPYRTVPVVKILNRKVITVEGTLCNVLKRDSLFPPLFIRLLCNPFHVFILLLHLYSLWLRQYRLDWLQWKYAGWKWATPFPLLSWAKSRENRSNHDKCCVWKFNEGNGVLKHIWN